MAIIGRLFSILFFIIVGYITFKLLKFIFKAGQATNEFNHRVNEMNKSKSNKKDNVIELDKNQYKVE
jgi:hypothetical protein